MGFDVQHFDRDTLSFLYREIFVRQNYHFVARNKRPVIFDCGANVGMASIYFKWLYPEAQITAFEPDPSTFQLLQRNMNENRLEVKTHNCALWDKDTELDFFIDSSNPGGLPMSTDGSRGYGDSERIQARRLSSFIEGPVEFLKLDVEGAEHRVLCDLANTSKLRWIRQMIVEYHHRIGNQKSSLGSFLHQLEHGGFEYQLHAGLYPVTKQEVYQDILISAYQR